MWVSLKCYLRDKFGGIEESSEFQLNLKSPSIIYIVNSQVPGKGKVFCQLFFFFEKIIQYGNLYERAGWPDVIIDPQLSANIFRCAMAMNAIRLRCTERSLFASEG